MKTPQIPKSQAPQTRPGDKKAWYQVSGNWINIVNLWDTHRHPMSWKVLRHILLFLNTCRKNAYCHISDLYYSSISSLNQNHSPLVRGTPQLQETVCTSGISVGLFMTVEFLVWFGRCWIHNNQTWSLSEGEHVWAQNLWQSSQVIILDLV